MVDGKKRDLHLILVEFSQKSAQERAEYLRTKIYIDVYRH